MNILPPVIVKAKDTLPISICTKDTLPISICTKAQVAIYKDTLPIYDGDYSIVPFCDKKTILPTDGKKMTNNITVEEIPYYEVSNEYGVTFSIGG